MWNRRCHAVTVRVIEFCYRLSSVILNSCIITCVVRQFNCPSVYVKDWDGGIRVSQAHLIRFWNPFSSINLILKFFLFEWEYVSFMMVSCIFWIGPRNGWVSYLNYAVHIYANWPCMGIFLQTILYAHKSSKDVPCKGIGAWFKTQIVRLAST